MIEIGTEVAELTAEHGDGTIWADVQGDIWMPSPFGVWMTLGRRPFVIVSQLANPTREYGPYRAVLGPPTHPDVT
ncbi:hypothetical protein I5G59_gp67 [Mycobacterium phage LilMcDreamy]|uniref:Uncharacterized protein n=1 Tax=Mycobacterium phage LilMcDreamy TaxID=2652422 RepID=A0A5P8D6N1_9CAUD|nr:hypothetical protein I5G59_gp67 [Mycobacterium phage LilMcDreamy]QFP94687.1 hypothetical protein SEA_LILMCDREAMY_67 [Mycobacterium phage LilMcDreamy]